MDAPTALDPLELPRRMAVSLVRGMVRQLARDLGKEVDSTNPGMLMADRVSIQARRLMIEAIVTDIAASSAERDLIKAICGWCDAGTRDDQRHYLYEIEGAAYRLARDMDDEEDEMDADRAYEMAREMED